jgi:hypothetical protein
MTYLSPHTFEQKVPNKRTSFCHKSEPLYHAFTPWNTYLMAQINQSSLLDSLINVEH